jgi:hypothetical protein
MISVLFLVAGIQSFRFQTLSLAMILSCVYIANVVVAKNGSDYKATILMRKKVINIIHRKL